MTDDRVLALLMEYEDRREAGEPLTPEQLCADAPELLDPVRRMLGVLQAFEAAHEAPADADDDDGSESAFEVDVSARYRPEGLHARGGLGEVHVASDVELGRRVALKRIRPAHADRPDARRRFLREAILTARLEHPGIVPVYGMMRDGRGQPCYAMRLIEGEPFSEAIARVHGGGPDRVPPAEALRPLLVRFVAACHSVAYAHARGVVHRDLKPSNIMLGRFGETLVVDWGLAAPRSAAGEQAAPEIVAPTAGDGAHGVADAGDGAWMETHGGGVGTLGFSAPEQLEGRPGSVAPAADIYALGAVLHAILCGRAPRVYEPPAGRRPHRRVSRPLWAVCRKAMDPDPARRYADAEQLAAEVERALAGERVEADREPWVERAGRRARRHRVALAATGAALLVAATIGGVIWRREAAAQARRKIEVAGLVAHARPLIERARTLEADARDTWLDARLSAALAAWQRAEDRLDQAGRPADLWPEVHESRTRLDGAARVAAGLQRARLDGAAVSVRDAQYDRARRIEGYRRILRDAGLDPIADSGPGPVDRVRRLDVAEPVLAAVDDWITDADPPARERLIAFATPLDPDPERARLRTLVGEERRRALLRRAASIDTAAAPGATLLSLGLALAELDEHEAAVRLLTAAVRLHPDDFWINRTLGTSHAKTRPPRPDLAANHLAAAIALSPTSAGPHVDLAYALAAANDWAGATAAARRAIELAPDLAPAHHHLALSLQRRGLLHASLGAYVKAVELDPNHPGLRSDFGTALAEAGQVARGIEECRRALALRSGVVGYHLNLGSVLRGANRREEAAAAYRDALAVDSEAALVHFQLGSVLTELGRVGEAVEIFRGLVALEPRNAVARGLLGANLVMLGEPDEAVPHLRTAIALDARHANALNNLGVALYLVGAHAEALAHLRESARLKAEANARAFGVVEGYAALGDVEAAFAAWTGLLGPIGDHAGVVAACADVLLSLGDEDAALAHARDAVGIGPNDPYAWTSLGTALAAAGRRDEALDAFDRAIAIHPNMAEAHWGRGMVLLEAGRSSEAHAALARGHASGLNPAGGPSVSSAWVGCAERADAQSGRLAAVADGAQPATPEEGLALAQLALGTGRPALAARLYEKTLATEPGAGDDRQAQPRVLAATAAVQASRGRDRIEPPPDAGACGELRARALGWLKAELTLWCDAIRTGRADVRHAARLSLRYWRIAPEFAPVRRPALAALPAREQDAWRAFWADVDAAISATLPARADGTPTARAGTSPVTAP